MLIAEMKMNDANRNHRRGFAQRRPFDDHDVFVKRNHADGAACKQTLKTGFA
jgi:hypothetical protein